MDIAAAVTYAATHRRGVLLTLKADGRPQASNVMFTVGDVGVGNPDPDLIRVSLTDSRAKTRNVRRDPRVSLHVTAPDFWSYVVLEGEAQMTPVASDPGDATVDELVGYYRAGAGEHDDWDDYRRAMVADGRLVLRLRPTYAYGMLPGSPE